jgi:hypothetical protein
MASYRVRSQLNTSSLNWSTAERWLPMIAGSILFTAQPKVVPGSFRECIPPAEGHWRCDDPRAKAKP